MAFSYDSTGQLARRQDAIRQELEELRARRTPRHQTYEIVETSQRLRALAKELREQAQQTRSMSRAAHETNAVIPSKAS
jgi:hypothetical protein